MTSDTIMALVLVAGLFVLLAAGLEIAWSIGIIAAVGLMLFVNQPLSELAASTWSSMNSFVLTAAPLFIFMGAVLAEIGAANYLFSGLEKWVGRLPGGLANTVIAGNAVFAAMSGSSLAATAIFGKTAVPVAERMGYEPSLILGSVAIGAILAPLIPPSILLIIYGVWQQVSIASLFAAAIVPGVLLTTLLMATIMVRVKINPRLVPPSPRASWNERLVAVRDMLPFVVIIIAVLGTIFGGIMTPTEAAALGALLSLLLGVAYRRFNMAMLTKCLFDAVKVTSFALFILAMATVFTHVLNILGVFPRLTELVLGLGIGKYGILALFLVLYLVMGCFFDAWSMLFLTFPFVMPIITAAGFDPIWWGVIYVMAGEQSLVTPPFGMGLFVLHSVVPQYSIGTIVRGSLPFLIPIYVNILLLAAFPQIVLWLPGLFR
ncbi:MAG: TRAP transporter large permease subunit [Chloroflexi bacterium]|nr:TRAP transporter large permease subunit [Chloroflexota bacterium]